jgi:hypothetical protein
VPLDRSSGSAARVSCHPSVVVSDIVSLILFGDDLRQVEEF